LRKASDVLDQMIDTHHNNKTFKDVVEAVVDAVADVKFSSLGLAQLVYAYKNKFMFDEAVGLLLSLKKNNGDGDVSMLPNNVCLNSLMRDLLRNNKMELFWKVNERLSEGNVIHVITAYCKSGKMDEAKRVFREMEEKGCRPNLVTHGLVDEAIGYKRLMSEKGLVPDAYTYAITVEGLCKAKRSSLVPKPITYSYLVDGFRREGKIDEALSSKDEMVAKSYEPQSALWCFNVLMRDLLRLDKMKCFWNEYDKMLALKLKPDSFTYTNLIGGYARVGKLDEAKKLFSEMSKKGYNPNLVTYNVFISGLCKAGLTDEAFELKRSMAMKGLRPDIFTYTSLIDGLCKLKRSQDAKLLLEEMPHVGLFPDNFTYTALIDGFLKQGEVDEAFKLKDEMVAKGIEVNLVTYNCIIDGLCKLGQCDMAIEILEKMKEEARVLPDANRMEEAHVFLAQMVENGVKPNAFTYGAFILAYNDLAEVKVANVYFSEMIGLGIVPDQAVLASMIDGHCKEGNTKEALAILNNMLGKSSIPDVQIYNAFVQGFSKNQMMEMAMEVVSKVREKGLNLDVFAYSSLITGFIKQGDLQKAFQLFDEMRLRNVRPNTVTYNTLINGLCKTGDVKRARALFDKMLEEGVMVNTSTYTTLIDGYRKSKNIPEAFKLLDEMPMTGIEANESVYGALVKGCCEEGDTERAFLVFDRMVESGFASTPTFSTLIHGLCKLGKLNEVNAALKDMFTSKNVMLSHATFSILIHHHCKLGMIKEAEHLLMEMKTKKMTPKIEAYAPLLNSYVKSGENSKISTIFEDLISLGTSKNEASDLLLDILSEENSLKKTFELLGELSVKDLCCRNIFDVLLYTFCKKGKFSEALSSLDELKKRGLALGFDTCKTLIVGLKSGDYNDDDVAEVLEKMVKFGWVPGSTSVNELISQEETDVKEVNMSNEAAFCESKMVQLVCFFTLNRSRTQDKMIHVMMIYTRLDCCCILMSL
ncbi:hypothetical protein M8C21_012077, partial [Ambrosia artemisiifolia]